jgi:hypothetical protein
MLAKSHLAQFEYLWDVETRQSHRDPEFRSDVHNLYYNRPILRKIKCMITGKVLPADLVGAGHLFKRNFKRHALTSIGLDNIDDPKNGMLMYKPIEHAFNTSIISLVSTGAEPKGNVRVFLMKPK